MRPWLRLFIASSAGAMAYLFVHGPLSVSLNSPILAGVVVGLVAALAAPADLAIVGAILGVIAGELLDLIPMIEGGWHADHLVLGAAAAGGVAWGAVRALSRTENRWRGYLGAIGLTMVIIGMIAGVMVNVQRPIWQEQSFVQLLENEPVAFTYSADESIYMRTYALMHNHGLGYYEAARKARFESVINADAIPGGAISYRLPAGYVAWSLFPGPSGVTVIPLLLIMGVFAVLSAFIIGERLAGMAAALVSAAAVALFYGEMASNQAALHVEPWSAAVALGSFACLVLWRTTTPEHRRWLWGAAALAFAAASIRELAASVMIAGLVSSYFADKSRRLENSAPWLIALGAFAVYYTAHYMAVGEGLLSNRGSSYWLQFNIGRLSTVVSHGLSTVPGSPLVPVLLTGFALAAALTQRDLVVRVWLLVGMVVPTMLFSVFGPAGTATFLMPDAARSTVDNLPGYWGGLVSPLLLTMGASAGPLVVRSIRRRPVLAPAVPVHVAAKKGTPITEPAFASSETAAEL